MANIELLGFAQSTYVRTVRLVCEEKSIQYTLLPLEFRAESHRAVHPFLRMPVMRHGDLVLFETLAIATYLNEQFAGTDLAAGTAAERARMYQWISAACDYVYKGVVARLAKADATDPKALADALELLQPLDDALLRRKFLAGDALTLADLFLMPMLSYANSAAGTADWLTALPRLAAWLRRLEDQPAALATAA